MKFSDVFTSKNTIQLDKKTLTILRWFAIIGQYISISIVYFIFNFELPFFYCSAIILLGVITNFYLQFAEKENQLSNIKASSYLLYDLIQLSFLLFFYGWRYKPICNFTNYSRNSIINLFKPKKYSKLINYYNNNFNCFDN